MRGYCDHRNLVRRGWRSSGSFRSLSSLRKSSPSPTMSTCMQYMPAKTRISSERWPALSILQAACCLQRMLLGRAGAASDLFLDYACRDEWPPQPVERRGLRHALPLHWRAVWTTVAGGFTKNGRPHELRTTVASHCVGYGFLKFLTAPKAERLWHAVTPWTQSLPKEWLGGGGGGRGVYYQR